MARTLAYLRINAAVTGDAARLTTGLPGSALAGRVSHPLDDDSEFQGGIVNLLSQLTSIAWSHPKADVQCLMGKGLLYVPLALAFALAL